MDHSFSHDVSVDGVSSHGQLMPAFFAGLIACLGGAFIWMFIPQATGLDVGYAAIGVGALVGVVVRYSGNGGNLIFGLLGSVLTLIGSVLGEILASVQLASDENNDFFGVLNHIDLGQLISSVYAHTSPLGFGIYALGVVSACFLSMRK